MKFHFEIDDTYLNSYEWGLDKEFIKGNLELYVTDQLCLKESQVNIVELAIQLAKWLDSVRQGRLQDFEYNSIDCDESILKFVVRDEGIHLISPMQKIGLAPLAIEEVKQAVLCFLVALNEKLYELNYAHKLNEFLVNHVSDNRKAIMLLEQNEDEAALELLKKLAKESPSVQSINNLAWFYLHEKEEMDEAERLLEQALHFRPQSPFPYMMLGEIALHKGNYERAKHYLQVSLTYSFTEEATFNLAIAHFQLKEYARAAEKFASCAGESGPTQLHEVVALLFAGEKVKAKSLLNNWNEDAYDYTGAIEIADVYVELECFAEAREQFEKEWDQYVCSPYIISRFAYTLFVLGDTDACTSLITQSISRIVEDIEDVRKEEVEENWTVEDKEERIVELQQEKQILEGLYNRLERGYVPTFEYDMYPMSGCQLFGCMQHRNAEYEGE